MWEPTTWSCTSMLWSTDSCRKMVSADLYLMAKLRAQGRSIEVTRFFEVLRSWQVTSSKLIAGSTPSGFFAMGSSLLLKLNYKFINGSQLWAQPSLQGFSVAVPFLSISWFWRNLTKYRKHLPMVNAMVIKDKPRDLSQSETETLYYNKLELFLLWIF